MLIIENLSRRDEEILKLAYEISLVLGTQGRIPTNLLDQIFAQFVFTNPRQAMLHLVHLKLIKHAPLADQMVVAALGSYEIKTLFGDEPMPMRNKVAQSIVANWRNGDSIFGEECLDEDPTAPLVPMFKPTRVQRKADAVLNGIDVAQLLADIKMVTDTNHSRPLRVDTIDTIIKRHCLARISSARIREVLHKKGLLAATSQKDEEARLWSVTADGINLIEDDFAEPSLSRQEVRRILNKSGSRA